MELADVVRIKEQVTKVHGAVQILRSAGIREEALVVLITAACPRGPRGGVQISAAEVRTVLRGIESLPAFVFEDEDSPDGT